MEGLTIITAVVVGLIFLALIFGAMARKSDLKERKNRVDVDDFF